MTLVDDVEREARAQGLWRDSITDFRFSDNRVGLHIDGGCCDEHAKAGTFRVWTRWRTQDPNWEPVDGPDPTCSKSIDVSAPAALVLVRLAALPPMVRPCPDCEGAKVESAVMHPKVYDIPESMADENVAWHRERWETVEVERKRGEHGDLQTMKLTCSRPCPTCTGPAVECEACEGEGGWSMDDGYASWWHDCDECDECDESGTLPGKPTGHVDRPWAGVLLGAMPRECADCRGSGFDSSDDGGEQDSVTPHGASKCASCWARGFIPGDPEARTMLTARVELAQRLARYPANVEVWLDYRLAAGAIYSPALRRETEEAITLAPMAIAVDLMLAGAKCGACDGEGRRVLTLAEVRAGLAKRAQGQLFSDCPNCEGHGTALARHLLESCKASSAK